MRLRRLWRRSIAGGVRPPQQKPENGFAEFIELAKAGSVWSMIVVAYDYEFGVGVDIEVVEAENWYRRAWEGGAEEAGLRLGHLYEAQDRHVEAEAVYRRSAEAGWAPAMTHLAKLILRANASRGSAHEAKLWLERAADGGDRSASMFLAFTMMIGRFGVSGIIPGFRSICDKFGEFVMLSQDYGSTTN